jgi:hypothetical protein
MLPIPTYTSGELIAWRGLNYTGTACRIGMALQAGAASGDEFLALVGRLM